MFRIMSMTLMNINPQKEIFHHYDFPVYTTSKYRDPKLDTYRRITHNEPTFSFFSSFEPLKRCFWKLVHGNQSMYKYAGVQSSHLITKFKLYRCNPLHMSSIIDNKWFPARSPSPSPPPKKKSKFKFSLPYLDSAPSAQEMRWTEYKQA